MAKEPQQQSLFPTADSLEQIEAEAKAALPITDENELMALLHKHQNTILHLQEADQ